jgi:hydroxymethylglutaryl-CoA reductase (NADPH)
VETADPEHTLADVPRAHDDDFRPAAIAARRELCAAAAGRPLTQLFGAPVAPAEARGNVENFVGFAQVPVGIAGPLVVDTSAGRREVYVPLATNEGALVASTARGMRLLKAAGGARARVIGEGLTQNPILVYPDAAAAAAAAELARASFDELVRIAARHTRHGRLVTLHTHVLGRRLVVSLGFTSGDAVGINMAARAADDCSAELEKRSGAEARYVHGQDVEKRANARALLDGRGRSVVCDARVPRAALAELARTTPEALAALWRSYSVGFAHLGTHNWLVQSANTLAAVMLACGQDVAYLTECATGLLDLEVAPTGDLYASVTLPALLVGTVGGGTQKGTAAECLALLGCQGPGSANTFAEILAAVVLAGDLSLMAAFASHEFVAAHERLGRNRPPAHPGSA